MSNFIPKEFVYDPRFTDEIISEDPDSISDMIKCSDIWKIENEIALAKEKLNYD